MNGMVEEEFHALPVDLKASILRIATLIRENGLEKTGMPYVRHLQCAAREKTVSPEASTSP